MPGWNLALRFGLEMAALGGLGALAWILLPGAGRWIGVVAAPLAAAVLWAVFNVPGDPSRSGEAPVEVPGAVRLAIELAVLLAGAVGLGMAFAPAVGIAVAVLIAAHYATSRPRIRWLLAA